LEELRAHKVRLEAELLQHKQDTVLFDGRVRQMVPEFVAEKAKMDIRLSLFEHQVQLLKDETNCEGSVQIEQTNSQLLQPHDLSGAIGEIVERSAHKDALDIRLRELEGTVQQLTDQARVFRAELDNMRSVDAELQHFLVELNTRQMSTQTFSSGTMDIMLDQRDRQHSEAHLKSRVQELELGLREATLELSTLGATMSQLGGSLEGRSGSTGVSGGHTFKGNGI